MITFQDKSDHTDNESFEYIGSEDMNSLNDMEEQDFAGNISEGNAFGILDLDIADASKNVCFVFYTLLMF